MPGNGNILATFKDAVLISLYQQGNELAFSVLVSRHGAPIIQYLMKLLNNAEDAKDVSQIVWVEVAMELRNGLYHEQQNFSLWLQTVTYRQAVEFLRWRFQVKKLSIGLKRNFVSDLSSRSTDRKIKHRDLVNAIHKLSLREQQVLTLHFFRKMTLEEIAANMNRPLGTIRSDYCRALKRLRVILNAAY